jgi:hypothetical protein
MCEGQNVRKCEGGSYHSNTPKLRWAPTPQLRQGINLAWLF